MRKIWIILLMISLVMGSAVGCAQQEPGDNAGEGGSPSVEVDFSKTDAEMFTERDTRTEYDASKAITIALNGDTATASSDSVRIEGGKVTITEEGTYIVSGKLDDGMLIVHAADSAKLQLVLAGVDITSASSAALYILGADKVFVTLAEGTENSLSNGGVFNAIDDNNIDGAIFSKQDLTINGTGRLVIGSPAGHGIVCKDDLVITGGVYEITAGSHGLDANDSIRIKNAKLSIDAGKDAVHAENEEDSSLGFVYMTGGEIKGNAKDDGISASGYVQIGGGNITIESTGDNIHADTSILISGGTFALTTEDDGIHAEESLTITGGQIEIAQSYEGLEALHIDIQGGDIKLAASDDGLNAAGGTDQGGTQENTTPGDLQSGISNRPETGGRPGGGRPDNGGGKPGMSGGHGGMSANSNGSIKISGGKLYIKAYGDGIDANGTIEITGGHITVVGPTRGDTATLDYDKTATISGGTFIGTGALGMAQTFSESSHGVIALNVGNQTAGTEITLKNSQGETILTYAPELDFAVVILSGPDIVKGETYSITVGSASGEFQAN